jgi:hypothetical protein
MNTTTRTGRTAFTVRLLASSILGLCLLHCSAEQPQDAKESDLGSIASALEHCGGISCSGTSQCQTAMPLCAIATSPTCLPDAPRECAYKLNISSSCPCLEHDVRLCTLSGGGAGVQICTANAQRTATSWATCTATPACSP